MKKSVLLTACLLSLVMSVFAGKTARQNHFLIDQSGQPFGKPSAPATFTIGNIIYTEDFSNGIPSGWQLIDNAGNGVNWKLTTTGIYNAAQYPQLISRLSQNGTTAANGYMLYDSDSSGQTVQGEDADMITGSIDCSNHATVRLSFQQFLYHFYESATVSVSNDGTSWTQVFDASASLATNAYTTNPDEVDIDITSLAGNQATVYIKFNFTGDYDYWWMIDDITLYEPVNYTDASLTSILSPASSCAGLGSTETISVFLKNAGTTAITSVDLSYTIDGGAAISESSTFNLPAGDSLSYLFSTPGDFSAPGSHTLTIFVSTPGDTNQLNDTIVSFVFNGSRLIDGANDYSTGFESNEDLTGWLSEDFNNDANTWNNNTLLPRTGDFCATYTSASSTQFANDWLFSPCIELNDSTVYQLDHYYRTFNSATDAYLEIALCTAQNSSALAAPIQLPLLVTNINYLNATNQFTAPSNGTYYIGFHVLSGTKIASLRLDDISISVSTGVGMDQPEESYISIYPNPAGSTLTISGGKGSNYSVALFNLLGDQVYNDTVDNLRQTSLDVSILAPGVYMLALTNDKYRTFRKIVIE